VSATRFVKYQRAVAKKFRRPAEPGDDGRAQHSARAGRLHLQPKFGHTESIRPRRQHLGSDGELIGDFGPHRLPCLPERQANRKKCDETEGREPSRQCP